MSKGLLIACTGYAMAGKDQTADILASAGYVKLGFSDALCNVALDLNPWVLVYRVIPVRLKWLVARIGWTAAKRFPSVRKYLQWLGTEVGRKHLGTHVWINALKDKVDHFRNSGKHVVITNARFVGEAQWVLDEGGFIARIDRAGVGPVNGHSSDRGDAFPFAEVTVNNHGSLEYLAQQCVNLHNYAVNRQLVLEQQKIAQDNFVKPLSVFFPEEDFLDTVSNPPLNAQESN